MLLVQVLPFLLVPFFVMLVLSHTHSLVLTSALVLDLAKPMTLKTDFVLMSFVATDFLLANPPLLKKLYLLLPVVNLSFFSFFPSLIHLIICCTPLLVCVQ